MKAWLIRAKDAERFEIEREGVTLTIPATQAGLRVFMNVLLGWDADAKIGTAGFPTQAQLDQMVKSWREANPPQYQLDLKDLGL